MTLVQKIRLSWNFAAGIYVVSAIFSLVVAVSALFYPTLIPTCLFLKFLSIPIILYLFSVLQKKLTVYFYINLGISRMEYYLLPVFVELIVFLLLITLSACIGNAIGR